MTPEQLANRLAADIARISDVADDLLETWADEVDDIEYGLTHKRSGDLAESQTVFGPYHIGEIHEARIVPVDIPYAEIEATRGEDHNFAARAIAESKPEQERMRRNLERSVARLLGGR